MQYIKNWLLIPLICVSSFASATIILKKAVESTPMAYCTDSSRLFDDFLLHRMGDTVSEKNHRKVLRNQHIRPSRYDSTAFFRIIDHFEAIKSDPKALYTFFKDMPKGGELHYHFDGSSPAETMLALADRGKYCLNPKTQAFKRFTTLCHGITASQLLKNRTRYNQTIRAWSMKNFTPGPESRLDHFFSVFAKERTIQSDFDKQLLAHIIERAANQHELYLEVIAFHLKNDSKYAQLIHSTTNMRDKKRILLSNPHFQNSIRQTIHDSDRLLKQARHILGCQKTMPRTAACSLTVKFQYYVIREESLDQIFAQALAGFETAAQSNNVVGINLVGGENGVIALRDYKAQMQIFQFMHSAYPNVHIALHAGELAPDLVKPEQLLFHIHDAVFTGKAERIGHGVDITHENNRAALIKYMSEKPVAVEINLTSNRELLTIYGKQHPLCFYLKHHIPIVLSTDDEGILRTDLTHQYVDAVMTYKLDYPTIKAINRNALTYSFLPGDSLWSDAANQIYVPACRNIFGATCLKFIKKNMKAALQWELEKKLKEFENEYSLL